jgi:7,8-dihydro-6-hydroxymethylpterin dimethyltransferase
MKLKPKRILSVTESVCPECLSKLPARCIAHENNIYLEKNCPEHGLFQTVIWRGEPAFTTWVRPKTPAYPSQPFTPVSQGCPYDCGLCPEHRQRTCCVLLEVTQRCDLGCPVCYAASPAQHTPDPDLKVIEGWYHRLLEAGGPFNIQLSGGEPCLRDDLPQIIALGKSLGFAFFQLNTNGLRLAADPAYLQALIEAGLSTVFLQFDSLDDEVYARLRGRHLLEKKIAALQQCIRQGIGVMLVPTLAPGANTHEIGTIIEFALQHAPAVRGVHFQPMSFFGRYPLAAQDENRITLPEVIREIEQQTRGRILAESFRPPGGENALCSFHGNFVLMPDGQLKPLTRHNAHASCCCPPEDGAQGSTRSRQFVARAWAAPSLDLELPVMGGPSLGEWDIFLARLRTHTFCVSGMAFQDAWNLDLGRLKDCYIHILSQDGKLIPFCAYNLTSQSGRSLYRNGKVAQETMEVG